MFMSKRSAMGSAFFAFIGAVFCTLNATQNFDAICITTGCEIFKDISVYGISLWWIGTALFLALTLLNIFRYAKTALLLVTIALIIDLGFLLLMAFTAPCVPCLIFAAMLLILFLMQSSILKQRRRLVMPLLMIWALLFTPNLFATINEEMGTWAIYGPAQSDVQVFFSPSCTACQALVPKLSKNDTGNVTYYPVAETEADIESIMIMNHGIKSGNSLYIAFNRALRAGSVIPEATFWEKALLRWDLFRNKSKLASMGVTRIPVIITNGAPKALLNPAATQKGSGNVLDFNEGFSGCTDDSPEPCE